MWPPSLAAKEVGKHEEDEDIKESDRGDEIITLEEDQRGDPHSVIIVSSESPTPICPMILPVISSNGETAESNTSTTRFDFSSTVVVRRYCPPVIEAIKRSINDANGIRKFEMPDDSFRSPSSVISLLLRALTELSSITVSRSILAFWYRSSRIDQRIELSISLMVS